MSIPGLPLTGGSLQLYLKNQGMKLTLERKKQGLEELTPQEREAENIRRQMADIRKGNVTASITTKLDSGQDLTDEEMAYLRTHNPQLYQQAVEIRKEREAYKKALRRCRTREDAARLNSSKLQSFAAQAKTDPTQTRRRMMAVNDEHSTFVRSKRYRELPTEEEVQKKQRKKPLSDGPGDPPPLSALLPPPPTLGAAVLSRACKGLDTKI